MVAGARGTESAPIEKHPAGDDSHRVKIVASDELATMTTARKRTRRMETYHRQVRGTSKACGKPKPPARTDSQRARILSLLRERGAAGVLASELYDQPLRFGRSPRNRLSELRKAGFRIVGEARGSSDWHYTLIAEPQPIPAQAKPQAPLPLFEGVA
jgi:hypothetical protein